MPAHRRGIPTSDGSASDIPRRAAPVAEQLAAEGDEQSEEPGVERQIHAGPAGLRQAEPAGVQNGGTAGAIPRRAGDGGVVMASIRWRRLDALGHDRCRLRRIASGWELAGTAFFLENAVPVRLVYRVACDPRWRTRAGHVRGTIAARSVDLRIERSPGGAWRLGGRVVPGLSGCLDLDLGFTPATNLLPIRRLALPRGGAADAAAAWLDVRDGTLARLPQRYVRRTTSVYHYEAPTIGYAADLAVSDAGFVTRYPGLWTRVSGSEPVS